MGDQEIVAMILSKRSCGGVLDASDQARSGGEWQRIGTRPDTPRNSQLVTEGCDTKDLQKEKVFIPPQSDYSLYRVFHFSSLHRPRGGVRKR